MFKILIFILGCVVAPVIIGKCGAVKKEWIKYRDYTNDNPHQEMTWKLFNSVFYIMDQTHRLYYGKNNTLFYRHDDTTRRLGYKDIYIKFNFFDYFRWKHFKAVYEANKASGNEVKNPNASNELLEIIQQKVAEELERSQKMIEEGAEGIKLVLERMEAESK